MLPRIKEAVIKLNKAKQHMIQVLAVEQEACPHARVIHSKWRSSEYGSPYKARRLCLDCGLEEAAKNFGWGDCDSDFKYLKTNGFHKIVYSNELYRARFPEAKVAVE